MTDALLLLGVCEHDCERCPTHAWFGDRHFRSSQGCRWSAALGTRNDAILVDVTHLACRSARAIRQLQMLTPVRSQRRQIGLA